MTGSALLTGSVETERLDGAPRFPAPVDRVFPDLGIRLRHLPGEVCLDRRTAAAPPVDPTPSLYEEIARCLDGDPGGLLIAKALPANEQGTQACPGCGRPAGAARLDVALGENSGLVVQDLPGFWCWECLTAVVSDAERRLRERLLAFDPRAAGEVVPSLLYDTPGHPRSVQFEITTRCNIACAYCSHRHLPEQRHLSLDRFVEMLDRVDLELVDNVDFTGLGEPLLNPELAAMVREVRRRSTPTHVRVVTNGTVLTPKVFAPLCAAGVTSIAVSIDSLDPDRFARTRGGARIAPVLANLESLVEHRRRLGLDGLRLKIKAVLLDDPRAEAEELLRYSARLGLDMPQLSCVDTRATAAAAYEEPWLHSDWAAASGGDLMAWACRRWQELTALPLDREEPPPVPSPAERAGGFLNPVLLPPSDVCRWAVDAAFVMIDGGTLSCCETMIDLPRSSLGSVRSARLGDLWKGDLLWRYRLPLAIGRLPAGCVGCPQAPAHGTPLAAAYGGPGGST